MGFSTNRLDDQYGIRIGPATTDQRGAVPVWVNVWKATAIVDRSAASEAGRVARSVQIDSARVVARIVKTVPTDASGVGGFIPCPDRERVSIRAKCDRPTEVVKHTRIRRLHNRLLCPDGTRAGEHIGCAGAAPEIGGVLTAEAVGGEDVTAPPSHECVAIRAERDRYAKGIIHFGIRRRERYLSCPCKTASREHGYRTATRGISRIRSRRDRKRVAIGAQRDSRIYPVIKSSKIVGSSWFVEKRLLRLRGAAARAHMDHGNRLGGVLIFLP